MAAAGDYLERGLSRDALAAVERARKLVDSLGEVVDHWHNEALIVAVEIVEPLPAPEAEPALEPELPAEPAPPLEEPVVAEEPPAEAAPPPAPRKRRQKPTPASPLAVVPPAPEPDEPTTEAEPVAAREMGGTTETIGAFEVKTIGARRFIRCPDVMCGRRVTLTDEQDQFEIADVLHSHTVSGDCLARAKQSARR